MVLTSDGKKIIGYSKGTNAANSGFIGTNDTLGVLEGTNACEIAFNGRLLNNFTFSKPTNAAFNTLVQSHVVHTDRIDPIDGPTHPYKCTCFNSNGTLYTRNTPGNFYISPNIAYMVRGNRSSDKMNALSIFAPGTLNSVTNVHGAFNNALMFDWNRDTYDCSDLTDMFVGCDFNNRNIIFNTVNGGAFLMNCTNVNTCRVRQSGGNSLPGIFNSSINIVDFICNVNGGVDHFYGVKANVFNLNANINNYRPTVLISSCQFGASNINLNFSNSPMSVIIDNTRCNANINNVTANYFCREANGNFNITNSKANNGAFVSSTGAINANLFNCTLSASPVISGTFNNSRLNFNSCNHFKVITDTTVRNVIINDYNSTTEHVLIYNSWAADTKCYWNKCNAYGFYKVNGSTEQHWEDSTVRYSIDLSGGSIHTVFFNNVSFGGNAIRNIDKCYVNCNIIGSYSSTYYTLLNCNNSVVNLNQIGNAGYPAGFSNNIKLNYGFRGTWSATRTLPIQYVYNSNIYSACELNKCNHTLPFATECRNTNIDLYDYGRNTSINRIVLTNSTNINLNYSCSEAPGRIYGVGNGTIHGDLVLNDCNNISGIISTSYQNVNMRNVTNSNIVLSPSYPTSYTGTVTPKIQYCNNVRINYQRIYNMPPVDYNTCTNMYLTTYSLNSVLFAPNNIRFDFDNMSLQNKMIVSNRCVALQTSNIFVQTVTTPGTNNNTTIYNLVSNELLGGSAVYMYGNYKTMSPSDNVRCVGMINCLRFSSYCPVTNSAMRVNVTYGTGLTFINDSYYATYKFDTLNASAVRINNSAFIAKDTSLWTLNNSYINNSVCVLGGQSTKWNTNRNIQFDNCLVIAVKWNRSTYGNIKFNNSVLVSSTAFGTLANNSTRVTSLAQAVVNSKYNTCMPSMFKMPIEGFKMLTGVTDAPDSSDISV